MWCILSPKNMCANQELEWIHIWWKIQHQQMNWYLSWFKSKRCHKEHFWDNSCVIVEQTERSTTRFPVTICWGHYYQGHKHSDGDASTIWVYHHMNLINACWKQLNIKHLSQQVLVAPNISSFALICRSVTTQIRSIGVYNAIPRVPFIAISILVSLREVWRRGFFS